MAAEGFYLGKEVDSATGEPTGVVVDYDPDDLTTHGVIVGMTGSGKTGLGVIFLEEALLKGIPTLILDPKGDMTNLALTFPDLRPEDFRPWIDESAARKQDTTVDALATSTAERWRKGLEDWGLSGDRIRELRDKAGLRIFTPGSTAGEPINIVGSLRAPVIDWDANEETLFEEIQGFVSGMLRLAGIEADPISSREHIFLSKIIEVHWKAGVSLDLEKLVEQVNQEEVHPQLRELGVFKLEEFFPRKARRELAFKLNNLIISPSFTSWTKGPELDVGSLMWDRSGKPQASVIYLAHLSDEERQFIVTLILSRLVTWMRSQSGSSELRALVYMDEVFGFVPPVAEPPAKRPILTLLKQARAFGVGMLLSTQNPVDLDYKAMSNAGTWCIGRLQTERDKARILEALKSVTGTADIKALDTAISSLDKRQFLLHSTHEPEPKVFTTRWAMSYLRGPLTRDQLSSLKEKGPEGAEALADIDTAASAPVPDASTKAAQETVQQTESEADMDTAAGAPVPNVGAEAAQEMVQKTARELADDESLTIPDVADGVPVYHLDPGARWAAEVGATPGARRHEAALAARVELFYDERSGDISHREEWEALFLDPGDPFDPDLHHDVDYDSRDFRPEAPTDAIYVIPDARIDTKTYFNTASRAIRDMLYREAKVTVLRNPELGLWSRVGESMEQFLDRCDVEAQARTDAEAAKLRDRYEKKLERAREAVLKADDRISDLEADLQRQRQSELLEGAGAVFDFLLGRRRTRSITGSAKRRSETRKHEDRLADARGDMADEVAELDDLEQELLEELSAINDEWEAKATEAEEIEIGLEKNDISIDELALVWIPVG